MSSKEILLNGRCQCGNLPIDCTCQQDKPLNAVHKFLRDKGFNFEYNLASDEYGNELLLDSLIEEFAAMQIAIAVAEEKENSKKLSEHASNLGLSLAEKEREIRELKAIVEDRENHVKFSDMKRSELEETIAARDKEIAELKILSEPLFSRRELEQKLVDRDKETEELKAAVPISFYRQTGDIERDFVGEYFETIHKNYQGDPKAEVENYDNTNTRLSLLKHDNRIKAFVIENRTAFNNIEFVTGGINP